MKKIFLSLTASVIFSLSAIAAVPDTFKYQAVVKGDDGAALANKEVNVKISVRHKTADGDILYAETQKVTTTNGGLLMLNVGEAATTTKLSDLNWADAPYFFEVEIDKGNGFESAGVQELLSVPYSQFAGSAESVVLTSPNGKQWKVVIGDDGNIKTEEVK